MLPRKQTNNFLGGPPKEGLILPEGYYAYDGENVLLIMGPFAGVSFHLGKIKIREDVLTKQPQLLYDYTILDSASFDASLLRSDPKLSRIIAAIIVQEFSKGGQFEIHGTT